MKFTQTNVATLRAPVGSTDHTEWDDVMPGFGIRFRDGGAGSYTIKFSLHGKQVKLGLGKVSKVALIDAKTEAQQHFAKIAKGENPALERAKGVAKATGTTIGNLVPLFIANQEAKGRVKTYVDENKRSLERYFSDLHKFTPDDVNRKMISAELDEITADHGPIAMTRSRAHLSKFFSWAIAKGHVEGGNPVSSTEKFESALRDRQHTEKELAIIWRESNDDNDFDVIQKLIMLTGARRNQIGSLKRKEIARNERQIILQGQGRSKNGTKFILPLSTQALALIEMVWDRRADKSGFLFGEGDDDAGGFSGWSNCTARFADNLGDLVEDYWLHDFRRTFQNIGQTKLKIPLLITEACMNHIAGEAKAGSKKHYNFADYLDEKIEAMDKWGTLIDGVVHPRPKLRAVN